MARYTDAEKQKQMLAKLVVRGHVGDHYTLEERIYSASFSGENGCSNRHHR